MTKQRQQEPPQNFEPGEWIWDPLQGKHIPLGLETNVISPDAGTVQESVSAGETGDAGWNT